MDLYGDIYDILTMYVLDKYKVYFLFIQQTFIESLLCAKHLLRYSTESIDVLTT